MNKKFKIGSCTVLYNPDSKVIENINSYAKFMDYIVLVDNSDNGSDFEEKVNLPNIKYISMNGNKGIAAALNKGLNYLIDKGADYALTMDQDSLFPSNDIDDILNGIYIYSNKYSILGLNFNYESEEKNNEVVETPYWITSGNFVNLKDFSNTNGFDEKLFIDGVDFEYGYELSRINKKIAYLKNYSLKHNIGNPIEFSFLRHKYHSMNHSPIRYYYRYRNERYLYKKINKKFFRSSYYKEIFINLPKMLIFEKNRKNKIKMIIKGIKDADKGIMGKYNEENIQNL